MKKMDYSILSKYRTQLLGISIILIIVFHFFEDYSKLDINGIVFNISKVYNYIIGSIGVEFFLFLSGMGLYYSLVKKYDVFYFYKKRLIRVLIPYMMYGFTFWFIKDIVIEKKTIGYFLYDYSLLSFWVEGNRNIWYITYILALYFITPFLYRFLYKNEKKRKIRLIESVSIIILICTFLNMYCFEWYDNIEIALTRTPVFIFGLFMGKDIAEKKNISFVLVISGFLVKLTSILLVGFDLIIGEYAKELNRFANGLYSIALIIVISYLICCIKSDIINKSLYKIGEYSLELYLTHVTVRTIFIICGISTAILFNYIICILISILLSILLHRLSEIVIYKVKF